jgi:hypothetical protein
MESLELIPGLLKCLQFGLSIQFSRNGARTYKEDHFVPPLDLAPPPLPPTAVVNYLTQKASSSVENMDSYLNKRGRGCMGLYSGCKYVLA